MKTSRYKEVIEGYPLWARILFCPFWGLWFATQILMGNKVKVEIY